MALRHPYTWLSTCRADFTAQRRYLCVIPSSGIYRQRHVVSLRVLRFCELVLVQKEPIGLFYFQKIYQKDPKDRKDKGWTVSNRPATHVASYMWQCHTD